MLFLVVILPISILVAYQVIADIQRAKNSAAAFDAYKFSNQANDQYKLFLTGVSDAVDSGSLGSTALNSLKDASDSSKQLLKVYGAYIDNDVPDRIDAVYAKVRADPTFSALISLQAEIRGLSEMLIKTSQENQNYLNSVISSNDQAAHRQAIIAIAILTMGWLISAFFVRRLVDSLMRPLKYAIEVANNIASGNLNSQIKTIANNEIDLLLLALHKMNENLAGMVKNISVSAEQVRNSAQQVSATILKVTNDSETQSAEASSMAATMEQMSVSIDLVAEHAKDVQVTSTQNGTLSSEGSKVILQIVTDMLSIADTVNQSSIIIRELSKHSDEIFAIVQVIKGIANQTNLLALNAAIEAACAGEQGRGFAVVADEVRKLAENTAQSTQVVNEMISKIQNGTQNAVKSMEVCVNKVTQGVALADHAGKAINQISSGAQQVNNVITDISSAIKEQSEATANIARNVERVAQMSDENLATSQSASTIMLHLADLAVELENSVSKFKS